MGEGNFITPSHFFVKNRLKLTKNAKLDKYSYFGYDISFDVGRTFWFSNGGFIKKIMIFSADMSSSAHVDNKEKYMLILGKSPTQPLGNTTLTAEAGYSILVLQNREINFVSITMEAKTT